ncbi:MAG: hypothetical protein LC659_05695 [Myxococcales bacterium]|nr:hypothetical protein [Myxococcales bacterium]
MRRLAILLLALAGCAHAPAARPTTATTATTTAATTDRYWEMTAALERHDYAGALRETDTWLASRPDVETVARIYNCRTWIRWAAGDKKAAAAENEKVRETVAGADEKVKHGMMLHYLWDRAYLEAEAGKLDDAARSRDEFFALASAPDDADSKHVLDAWLAFRRGEAEKARAEASAVDPAKDGDLQDLYVLACALDFGGDAAGAASIRERIRNGHRYAMKPTILQQMERDGASRCR